MQGGFVVDTHSMPGNPYDDHALADALQQVETLTGHRPSLAVADRGYRGHDVQGTQVLVSSTLCGLTLRPTRLLPRRSAIEPEIGHMKSDTLHTVLFGCGHNIRKILAYLRALLAVLLATLLQSLTPTDRRLFCSPSV